jgi:hypothetical protein
VPLLLLDVLRVFSDDELLQLALSDQRLRNQTDARERPPTPAAKVPQAPSAASPSAVSPSEPSEGDDEALDWDAAVAGGSVELFSEE